MDFLELRRSLETPRPRIVQPFDSQHPDWHRPPTEWADLLPMQIVATLGPSAQLIAAFTAAEIALPIYREIAAIDAGHFGEHDRHVEAAIRQRVRGHLQSGFVEWLDAARVVGAGEAAMFHEFAVAAHSAYTDLLGGGGVSLTRLAMARIARLVCMAFILAAHWHGPPDGPSVGELVEVTAINPREFFDADGAYIGEERERERREQIRAKTFGDVARSAVWFAHAAMIFVQESASYYAGVSDRDQHPHPEAAHFDSRFRGRLAARLAMANGASAAWG